MVPIARKGRSKGEQRGRIRRTSGCRSVSPTRGHSPLECRRGDREVRPRPLSRKVRTECHRAGACSPRELGLLFPRSSRPSLGCILRPNERSCREGSAKRSRLERLHRVAGAAHCAQALWSQCQLPQSVVGALGRFSRVSSNGWARLPRTRRCKICLPIVRVRPHGVPSFSNFPVRPSPICGRP